MLVLGSLVGGGKLEITNHMKELYFEYPNFYLENHH